MEIVETTIDIQASPQTVWSVLDDLPRYPEWNPVIPRLQGTTTLGRVVEGELVIPDLPTPPLTPTITRVVGARELRWKSDIPGAFTAEHIFILEPVAGGTHLIHREVFDGPAMAQLAPAVQALVKPAYENFDRELKRRAERFAASSQKLHPCVDNGASTAKTAPAALTLKCRCAEDPVVVSVSTAISHNHLCGCSKCWKPEGALLAQTATVPSDAIEVSSNREKLRVVDSQQSIRRHACSQCGVHMFGHVDDADHHFYGIDFVHPELAEGAAIPRPEFAGFVSSIVESGACASIMEAIRNGLRELAIPSFDAFSPEIMDLVAYHKVKIARMG